MIYELVLRNFNCSLEFVFSLLLLQPFNFSPVSFPCNFQDWGCVILREIDFLLKICWSIPCLHPSWQEYKYIFRCCIEYISIVQLQARGPHVALHSVFSGPRKHSGNIFKSEICWKACEVTFVLRNWLRWIKCICTRTIPFLCNILLYLLILR